MTEARESVLSEEQRQKSRAPEPTELGGTSVGVGVLPKSDLIAAIQMALEAESLNWSLSWEIKVD
jgi:hypothetical protein